MKYFIKSNANYFFLLLFYCGDYYIVENYITWFGSRYISVGSVGERLLGGEKAGTRSSFCPRAK